MKRKRKSAGLWAFYVYLLLFSAVLYGCGESDSMSSLGNGPMPSDPAGTEDVREADSGQPEQTDRTQEPLMPEETGEPETAPVTLSFTGDVYLSDSMVDAYRQQGLSGLADDTVLAALSEADVTMINHEYACTYETQKVNYQLYNFRSVPENEFILNELGVDIAGLSNNHILDYGVSGMEETLWTLKGMGIECAGAGKTIEEAKQAVIKEIGGHRIAFVAASHFVPDVSWHAGPDNPGLLTTYEGTENYQVLMDYIGYLKQVERADLVIIFAHFGVEKQNQFVPYQQQLSHAWIDAGADLIVGSHAHVLQGMECYQGRYIIYNLGNFWFGNYEKETAVLQAEIGTDHQITVKILPCVTKAFYIRSMNAEEAERLYRFLESISVNVRIDGEGRIH